MADDDARGAARLDGKVAVITGGTQGLGEAAARLFAARGAAGLVITGRNADNGERVAAEIAAVGCPTHFIPADLQDVAACADVVGEAARRFARLDCLVNCAGATDRGGVLDATPEVFDWLFAVNVRAPFFLMQAAANLMRRDGTPGTMVNIISMSAHGGQPFLGAYSASKGALVTLTRNSAYALMRDRIRINGLNIGWADTPGEHQIQKQAHGAADDWLVEAERDQPFGRLVKPAEVARAIAFLASDESGLMTGAIIDFDQSVLGAYDAAPQPAPNSS